MMSFSRARGPPFPVLPGIDHAGRIVRAVDENYPGPVRDRPAQFLLPQGKIRVCVEKDRPSPHESDLVLVQDKIRVGDNDLLSGLSIVMRARSKPPVTPP